MSQQLINSCCSEKPEFLITYKADEEKDPFYVCKYHFTKQHFNDERFILEKKVLSSQEISKEDSKK